MLLFRAGKLVPGIPGIPAFASIFFGIAFIHIPASNVVFDDGGDFIDVSLARFAEPAGAIVECGRVLAAVRANGGLLAAEFHG